MASGGAHGRGHRRALATGRAIGDVIRSVVGATNFVLVDIGPRDLDQLRIPAMHIQDDDRHRAKAVAAKTVLEAYAFHALLRSSYWRGCGNFYVRGHIFSVTAELLKRLQ